MKRKAGWRKVAGGFLLASGALLLVGLLVIAWYSPGTTASITDSAGRPVPGSVAEWEAIPVNGTDQWLLLRGQDSTKPVLLFLHGGPGLPEISLLAGHELEKRFVVVNWEQRGSGKSYEAAGFGGTKRALRVEQFVEDAAVVSRYLARRFRQPKIFLMAHSWGTFLGVLTVKKHPELFRAFFSISQIARQLEAEQLSYDWVLGQARLHKARSSVDRLLRQGRPPYPPDEWLPYLTWQRALVAEYRGGMYKANFYPLFIRSILFCREYTLTDKLHYGLGAQKAVRDLWPAVVETDLFQAAGTVEVPYYLFQGIHDYQTPYAIARRYFEHLKAPQKTLFTFRESAHSPIFEEPARFMQCLDSLLAGPVLECIGDGKTPLARQTHFGPKTQGTRF